MLRVKKSIYEKDDVIFITLLSSYGKSYGDWVHRLGYEINSGIIQEELKKYFFLRFGRLWGMSALGFGHSVHLCSLELAIFI